MPVRTTVRSCGYLRRTREITWSPSILGMFRSQISTLNGSDSSMDMARAPEVVMCTSGELERVKSISWYKFSTSGSSSSRRILGLTAFAISGATLIRHSQYRQNLTFPHKRMEFFEDFLAEFISLKCCATLSDGTCKWQARCLSRLIIND